jgi:hypothetical protein
MIDIRKALKLLDIIYVNENESVKSSLDKVTMLAQLDAPLWSPPGPFEQFYIDYEYMKQRVQGLESRVNTLEGYNRDPYTNHTYNSYIANYVATSPQFTGISTKTALLETKLQEINTLLATLTPQQEEDESELNSDTK